MHNLPSKSMVRRFRLAAWLLLLKWFLVLLFLAWFGYAMWREKMDHAYWAIGLAVPAAMLTALAHWIIAMRARCPLCFVPSFSHQQCSKHRKATHFLGSYRLLVALAVALRGWFRCPYCGEPTAMKVRRRSSRH